MCILPSAHSAMPKGNRVKRERERDRETERETEKDRERERQRQTDRLRKSRNTTQLGLS